MCSYRCPAGLTHSPMGAFLVSTSVVALAEMGDKTQLLALLLAARFRKPWPIVGGILVATLVNHALAGAVGAWVTTVLGPQVLHWVLGVWVVLGTTLGMLLANAPVVWLGERITRRVPLHTVHAVSAAIFLLLGVLALWFAA